MKEGERQEREERRGKEGGSQCITLHPNGQNGIFFRTWTRPGPPGGGE